MKGVVIKLKNEENLNLFKRIGERIQFVRKIDEITLEELSSRTKIPISRLQKWENGNGQKTPATDIYLIAQALEVDIEYLFFSEIEESVDTFFLAYKFSKLPTPLQDKLLEKLEQYSQKKTNSLDFWNDLITLIADGDLELLQLLKDIILDLLNEFE